MMFIFYFHRQRELQALLVVMEVSFWIFTYLLLQVLSIINNPATQVVSTFTSLGGIYDYVFSETQRWHLRKGKSRNKAVYSDLQSSSYSALQPLSQDEIKTHHKKNAVRYFQFLIFSFCIIIATYGPQIISLTLANQVEPSVEKKLLPIKFASIKDPNVTFSKDNSLIPSDFDINTSWGRNQIMYNLNVDYSYLTRYEDNLPQIDVTEIGNAVSYYLMGGQLFSIRDDFGRNQSCGFGDSFSEIILKKGPEIITMTLPVVPIISQIRCVTATSNDSVTNVSYPDWKLNPQFMLNPGENLTFFGIDTPNNLIYSSTLSYEKSNYTQHLMKNVVTDSRDKTLKNITNMFSTLNNTLLEANSNINFNKDSSNSVWSISHNVTEALETFINLYLQTSASFTLIFTLKEQSTKPSNETLYNRVSLGYLYSENQLTVTEAIYRVRRLHYTIKDINSNFSSPWANATPAVHVANVHILPLVANIKTGPFIYGIVSNVLGISVDGSNMRFKYYGKLQYNVTTIIVTIVLVAVISLGLLLFSKVILFMVPQGFPTNYGLLRFYHEERKIRNGADPNEIEVLRLLDVVDENAYEGVGYKVEEGKRRVGVIDKETYKGGFEKYGFLRSRIPDS